MIDSKITEYMRGCMVTDYEIIGDYYIGFSRVIFGYRVQAGQLFKHSHTVSICCGVSTTFRCIVKRIYALKMTCNLNRGLNVYEGLKTYNELKPVFNDIDYMYWLAQLNEDMRTVFNFKVAFDPEQNAEYIECFTCGKRSYSYGDIENKYCGMCKAYHCKRI